MDLLFFHRRLRCLVIIDLKLTELNHADVGQVHMYCNYAKEHWTLPDENPPVGLILCGRTLRLPATHSMAYPTRYLLPRTTRYCRMNRCLPRNWKKRAENGKRNTQP